MGKVVNLLKLLVVFVFLGSVFGCKAVPSPKPLQVCCSKDMSLEFFKAEINVIFAFDIESKTVAGDTRVADPLDAMYTDSTKTTYIKKYEIIIQKQKADGTYEYYNQYELTDLPVRSGTAEASFTINLLKDGAVAAGNYAVQVRAYNKDAIPLYSESGEKIIRIYKPLTPVLSNSMLASFANSEIFVIFNFSTAVGDTRVSDPLNGMYTVGQASTYISKYEIVVTKNGETNPCKTYSLTSLPVRSGTAEASFIIDLSKDGALAAGDYKIKIRAFNSDASFWSEYSVEKNVAICKPVTPVISNNMASSFATAEIPVIFNFDASDTLKKDPLNTIYTDSTLNTYIKKYEIVVTKGGADYYTYTLTDLPVRSGTAEASFTINLLAGLDKIADRYSFSGDYKIKIRACNSDASGWSEYSNEKTITVTVIPAFYPPKPVWSTPATTAAVNIENDTNVNLKWNFDAAEVGDGCENPLAWAWHNSASEDYITEYRFVMTTTPLTIETNGHLTQAQIDNAYLTFVIPANSLETDSTKPLYHFDVLEQKPNVIAGTYYIYLAASNSQIGYGKVSANSTLTVTGNLSSIMPRPALTKPNDDTVRTSDSIGITWTIGNENPLAIKYISPRSPNYITRYEILIYRASELGTDTPINSKTLKIKDNTATVKWLICYDDPTVTGGKLFARHTIESAYLAGLSSGDYYTVDLKYQIKSTEAGSCPRERNGYLEPQKYYFFIRPVKDITSGTPAVTRAVYGQLSPAKFVDYQNPNVAEQEAVVNANKVVITKPVASAALTSARVDMNWKFLKDWDPLKLDNNALYQILVYKKSVITTNGEPADATSGYLKTGWDVVAADKAFAVIDVPYASLIKNDLNKIYVANMLNNNSEIAAGDYKIYIRAKVGGGNYYKLSDGVVVNYAAAIKAPCAPELVDPDATNIIEGTTEGDTNDGKGETAETALFSQDYDRHSSGKYASRDAYITATVAEGKLALTWRMWKNADGTDLNPLTDALALANVTNPYFNCYEVIVTKNTQGTASAAQTLPVNGGVGEPTLTGTPGTDYFRYYFVNGTLVSAPANCTEVITNFSPVNGPFKIINLPASDSTNGTIWYTWVRAMNLAPETIGGTTFNMSTALKGPWSYRKAAKFTHTKQSTTTAAATW